MAMLFVLARKLIFAACLLPLCLACLPLYLVGCFIYGRPPIIMPMRRCVRHGAKILGVARGQAEEKGGNLVHPGIGPPERAVLLAHLLIVLAQSPIYGCFWFLDDVLGNRGHRGVEIRSPLFMLSAARSGSTASAHYIEDDGEHFIAPTFIEGMVPFMWLWVAVSAVVPRAYHARCRALAERMFVSTFTQSEVGREVRKRHKGSLFQTDTWEAIFGAWHNQTIGCLSSRTLAEEGDPGCTMDVDQTFLADFARFTHAVCQKTVRSRGTGTQTAFVKGHFLAAGDALAAQFPGARFFTCIREPVSRVTSLVNHSYCANSFLAGMAGCPAPDYAVLGRALVANEIKYCLEEAAFFNRLGKDRALVFAFDDFVRHMPQTMARIYEFAGVAMPERVCRAIEDKMTAHVERGKRRTTYSPKYNKSLAEVGVDEAALTAPLEGYMTSFKHLEVFA